MEDAGKLRSYELDHKSKMRLRKTHSHTVNGLAMDPGTREEKQLKDCRPYNKAKVTHQQPASYLRCGGEGGAEQAPRPTMYQTTAFSTIDMWAIE